MIKTLRLNSIKNKLNIAIAILVITIATSLPSQSFAATTKQAQTFIRILSDSALMSLTEKNLNRNEREIRMSKILEKNFDIKTIGRFALGVNWRQATKKQKTEYLNLFKTMIIKTYTNRFEDYSGQKLKTGKAIKSGRRDVLVSSQIIQPNGPPVHIEWRVRDRKGKLRIIDVSVENISMSVTQRSDFSSVIQRNGGDINALINLLREKTNPSPKKKRDERQP